MTAPKTKSPATHQVAFVQVYLTEQQLAARWAISIKTLQGWRLKGEGVKFCRLGRSIRYKITEIEAYEASQERQSTSEGVA